VRENYPSLYSLTNVRWLATFSRNERRNHSSLIFSARAWCEGLTQKSGILNVLIGSRILPGYGDPEVGQAFTCAHVLCDHLGETQQIAIALFGLGAFYLTRAEYKLSIKLAEQVLDIYDASPSPHCGLTRFVLPQLIALLCKK
jgi:hypothetical protein